MYTNIIGLNLKEAGLNRQPLPIPLISTPDGDLYFTDKKGTYMYVRIELI
jgi:hypothetical protein